MHTRLALSHWFLAGGLLMLQSVVLGADHPELKAFPAAKEGMERVVIVLPHKERGEEDAFKVELRVGRMMMTDGVNLTRLTTTIAPKPLEGWGYTLYEVNPAGPPISTMMAPPEGAPQVEKLVTAPPLMVRYNSRLPIVVYIPAGYVVHHRIWRADAAWTSAEQG